MAEKQAPTDDIMKDALERFEQSQEGSEVNREAYYEDFRFARMADQWPDAIKKQRTQEARPVLVINKLPALIRSVVNESRQNKPSIKVSPVDSGADEDTAEVISGLVRSIENQSNAEVAYNTAIDQAVTGGMGFFKIEIDYEHPETFDLGARIVRVPNALMVHWDTNSTAFDASDWGFGFVSDMMREREFKARYPDASMVPFDGDSRNDASDQWINEDSIRVAEYYLRTEKTRRLLQLAVANPQTGKEELQIVREEHLPAMAAKFFDAGGIDIGSGEPDNEMAKAFLEVSGVQVRNERDVVYHHVMRRIINGVEVLDEEEWPGPSIPICPVWGDEVYLDGRRNFRSMIRDAKDPQAMFNYWRSATTELVALAPKTPFIGPKGFVPNNAKDRDKWQSANTRSHAFMEYDPTAGAPPQRQAFAGVPAGALQEAMSANDDMKAITGIFDSSIGAKSNETSGKAILARERQGDVSNFHFIDNLSRAIRYGGQVLVDIIPAVYSASQTIRILGEDQAQNVIHLTQQAGGAKQKGVNGEPALYNLTVGTYDVTVSTGPSFATQREETRETLLEIMRAVPAAAQFVGDVLLDHMDFVGADKIAKRLKALLPPEVQKAEEAAEGSDDPEKAKMQAQMQQMQQQAQATQQQVMAEIQKITAENEQLKADHQNEAMKTQGELANKSRELDQKDAELNMRAMEIQNAPVPVTPQEQWDYDRAMESDKMAFQADQNDKDRQADLAKTIINKVDDEDSEGVVEGVAATAMQQAAEMLSAPKRVIRDENGLVVGVETVVQ